MKKLAALSVLFFSSLACATIGNLGGASTPTLTPYVMPTNPPQPTPLSAPTDITRRENVDIVCPSDVPEAVNAYNRGIETETAGDVEGAIKSYREAIDLDPTYCDAMDNLALLFRQKGDFKEALSLYQDSVQAAPDNFVAHLGLANTYMDLEDYDKALEEYEALVKLDPADPEGYYGSGRVHFAREKYREAITQFKTAEELYKAEGSPYVADAQVFIGFSYTMLEDYVNGRDYLEPVYPQFQDNPYVNYYLGYCYYYGESIRDDALARQYLSRARDLGLELEPELENFVNTP